MPKTSKREVIEMLKDTRLTDAEDILKQILKFYRNGLHVSDWDYRSIVQKVTLYEEKHRVKL
jgi:hypothetical protein